MSSEINGVRDNLRQSLTCTAGVALTVAVLVAIAAGLVGDSKILYREGGLIEALSLICWFLACGTSAWSALKAARCDDRVAAGWMAWLALLAALRELDAQIWLNPAAIGEYGVRYKINWWLGASVPLWLRLGWAALFVGVLFSLAFPAFQLRYSGIRLLRNADLPLVLLLASFVFLAVGFGVDDLLRGSRLLSYHTRQLTEETSELIGAVLFLVSMFHQYRAPWLSRLPASGPASG